MCTHARHARYVDANVDEVSSPISPLFKKKRKVLRNFDNFRRSTSHHPHNERKKGTNMILEKLSVLFEDPSYTVWSQNTRKDLYFIYLSKGVVIEGKTKSEVFYIYIYIYVRFDTDSRRKFVFGKHCRVSSRRVRIVSILTWAKGTWLSLLNAPEETMTMITLLSFTCRETTRTCGLKNSKLERVRGT